MELDRGQHGLTTKTQTACTHFSNRYWNDHSFEDTTKNCCERTEDRNGKNEHIFTLLMLCSWLQSVSVSRSEVEEEGWESAELPRHTCRNFILVRTTKLSLLSLPGKSREPLEERLREPREREERMESVREPRVMGVAPMSGMGGMAVGYPSGWLQEEGWMIPATRTRACGPGGTNRKGYTQQVLVKPSLSPGCVVSQLLFERLQMYFPTLVTVQFLLKGSLIHYSYPQSLDPGNTNNIHLASCW